MLSPSRHFPSMSAAADYIAAEAKGIRERATRASDTSKRIMSSEAAAYERCAAPIRNNIATCGETATPVDVLRAELAESLDGRTEPSPELQAMREAAGVR